MLRVGIAFKKNLERHSKEQASGGFGEESPALAGTPSPSLC